MLVALVLVGCTSPDPTPFLGAWQASGEGSVSLGPHGEQAFSKTSAGPLASYRIVIERGKDSALVSTDSFGCRLRWELSGKSALLMPGQRCTAKTRRAGATLAIESGTLTLNVVDAGRLSAVGALEGTISQGGALLGTRERATAKLRLALTREAPVPP